MAQGRGVSSFIYVTFHSPWSKVTDWRVLKDFSDSDHRCITYEVRLVRRSLPTLTDPPLVGRLRGQITGLFRFFDYRQRSILGPILWNIFYNDLLRVALPPGVSLESFADDVVVLAMTHTTPLLEKTMNGALATVLGWLTENGLGLAEDKSEAVVLSRKWTYESPTFRVNNHVVAVSKSTLYLGVTLDTRRSFLQHIRKAADSASTLSAAMARLTPNARGPRKPGDDSFRRRSDQNSSTRQRFGPHSPSPRLVAGRLSTVRCGWWP